MIFKDYLKIASPIHYPKKFRKNLFVILFRKYIISEWVRTDSPASVLSLRKIKNLGKSLLFRAEAESADLVIFKDHFTLPTFKRPPQQLWMIYLLGKTSSQSPSFFKILIISLSLLQNARSTLKSSSKKTFSTGRQLTEGTVPSLPLMKGCHSCFDDTDAW